MLCTLFNYQKMTTIITIHMPARESSKMNSTDFHIFYEIQEQTAALKWAFERLLDGLKLITNKPESSQFSGCKLNFGFYHPTS